MKKGFTLIELMIVVAIIAIIAAIAIPNLLRSRMSANESGAAGAMRTISTAEVSFQTAAVSPDALGVGQYGTLLELSAPPAGAPFIDGVLGAGTKHGYLFVAAPLGAPGSPVYTCTAAPSDPGKTGNKTYFVDESGVIRYDPGPGAADDTSDPL